MYFKQEDIEKLLDNIRIEKVVGDLISLKKTGSNYKGLCPFHDETTPSFMVSPNKQICKCFSCNTGGNAISFYSKYMNISFMEAVKELGKKYNVQLSEINDENEEKLEKYNIIMNESLEFYKKQIFEASGKEALKYLSERGLDTNLIKEYQLGYANSKWNELHNFLINKGYDDDTLLELGLIKKNEEGNIYDAFRNRIIYPIFSVSGRVIAFGGRTLEKNNPMKYVNSQDTPIFKKGHSIYGIERSKIIRDKNYAILMEGYMDVITANINELDTAVAPLGTAFTKEQAKLLKRYTSNVLLCFDMDKAGITATEKASFILKSENFKVKVINFTGSKDPDDFLRKYGKEEFLKAVKNSKEIFDYLYDTYKKEYENIDDMFTKQNFINRFKEFFQNVNDDLEKEMYLQNLSEKVNVEFETLKTTLVTNNVKKKYKTWEEKKLEEEEKLEKERVLKKIETKNITNENLEMEIINLVIKFPEYIRLFEYYSFENNLLNDLFNYFKNEVLEKKLDVNLRCKEIYNYINNNIDFVDNLKNDIFARLIMDMISEDNINIGVIKDILRKELKILSKKTEDLNLKKDIKQFEMKLQRLRKIESIIELYDNFSYLFKK